MEPIEETRRRNLLLLIGAKGGQKQLSDACGGLPSPAQISQWVNRSPYSNTGKPRVMGGGSARSMEEKLGLPIGWMDQQASADEAVVHAVATPETRPGYVRFPLLEGFAGMGRGDYMGDYPETVEFVEVTREWAAQKLRGVPSDAVRVITGRGPSMRGMFNDGDPIFLDSRVKQFLGDAVYCFRWNGVVYIKKLQMVGKGQARILSANPDYAPVDAPMQELEIGGRAIAAWTLTEF